MMVGESMSREMTARGLLDNVYCCASDSQLAVYGNQLTETIPGSISVLQLLTWVH
jgi:hypothetical protein